MLEFERKAEHKENIMKNRKIVLSSLLCANLFCACTSVKNTDSPNDIQEEQEEENTMEQNENKTKLKISQYTNLYETEPIWADHIYVDFYGLSAQNKSDETYDLTVLVSIQNEAEEQPYFTQSCSVQVPAHSFVYWGQSETSNGVDGLKPNASTTLDISSQPADQIKSIILSLDQVQFEEIDDAGMKSISYKASAQNTTDEYLQPRALIIFMKEDQPVYMAEGELNISMLEPGQSADFEGSVSSDLAPDYDEVIFQITGIYA
jgi:hypothetical protein